MMDLNHDPLCPVNTMAPNEGGCYCSLVRKVRADERLQVVPAMVRGAELVRGAVLASLRAKVEALKATGTVFAGGPEVIRRADVLDLIGGEDG